MRRVIVRFLAIAAVLAGVVSTGTGVAAADQGRQVADQGRPVGGDNFSAPPCGTSDIDIARGCFLALGPFFK
ncbi:MAG: hypothetical protein ACRDSR_24390 [Pseudonocardiaceae bacterium]